MNDFAPAIIDNLNVAAKSWERDWDRSIIQNFTSGGRPRWQSTRRGGAVLQKTGRLRNSISVMTETEGGGKYTFVARVQNLRYARIHQYGGIIRPQTAKSLAIPLTPEAEKKRPRDWGKDLFFVPSKSGKNPTLCTSTKSGKVTAQYVLMRMVRIPGRPYLVVQKEDAQLLKQLVKDGIIKGLGK